MRLFSFVGKPHKGYEETVYVYGGRECRTRFVQEALSEFFEPEEVVLFVTEGARETYEGLRARLPNVRAVRIPDGKSVDEMWEIFDRICDEVEDGESIVFDITHGFRAIPFISFLAVGYLKQIKSVSLRVVYGMFEEGRGKTPIVDLTEFSTILDWMTAVNSFVKYSNAVQMSEMVEEVHQRLWRERRAEPRTLKRFGSRLRELSYAIHLSRPIDSSEKAKEVIEMIPRVVDELRFVPPLSKILAAFEGFRRFACGEPGELSAETLRAQLELIKYQIENDLVLQAVELAREWVVNYCIYKLDYRKEDWLKRDVRAEIEKALRALVLEKIGKEFEPTGQPPTGLTDSLRNYGEIVDLWNRISSLRNDLAHCGMSEEARSVSRIFNSAKEVVDELERIYETPH